MTDLGARRPAPPGDPSGPDRTTALLDALFAHVAVGIAFWDCGLRYERINDELAAMNGVPVSEHLGRRPSEVLPELGAWLEQTLQQVLDTGDALRDADIEGETQAAPGVVRHWRATYFPVQAPDGRTLGVAGLVVEVTGERRAHVRADRARRRSALFDAELQALYAALPVGVAFLSRELRYQRVNETLAALNGRSVDEHIGASLDEILGEPAADLRPALQQVLSTRRPLDIEVSMPLPHDPGDVRALEATYFPVIDEDDQLLGVGAVVRDVTGRRMLEVEQSRLLREALLARADAEAAQVRTDDARHEAQRIGDEASRARARMTLLAEAGRRMAESLDWETTLRAVVRSVVPEIADWCSLAVVEPHDQLRVVAIAHGDPERERLAWELLRRYPPDPAASVGPAEAIRTGELQIVTDITPETVRASARDAEHEELLASLDVRHLAIAPLATPKGTMGALTFVLGDSGRRFDAEDLKLVQSLATRAALHIENARLYTERSQIARTLQTSLLPHALPVIPGVEVAARYRAAGEQNMVGGDFYDVFRSGPGVWTAIVGDVSGKGAGAAALTALARHTLRTASRLDESPAANLALLNDVLIDDDASTSFCTVFQTRLCPGERGVDLRFANGGHPAPLLLRADGTVVDVNAGRGTLVGAVSDGAFTEATMHLARGELLLLYTDGVIEVKPSDLDLGERELRATLAAHAGAPPDEIVAAVERRVVDLQSGTPRDDIVLVAIHVPGDDESQATVGP
jgi:PAS domain S-box-containing protein